MPRERLSMIGRITLATRIWREYMVVQRQLARYPLPECVAVLSSSGVASARRVPVRRLSRAVDRALRIGSHGPRCLITALVLFRMLRMQGDPAELVIGLPESPENPDAHAWVEIHGTDVGPPPGRGHFLPMVRYP